MQGSYPRYVDKFLKYTINIGLVEGLKECAARLTRWSQIDVGYYPQKIQEKRKTRQVLVQEDRDGTLLKLT